MFWKTNSSNVVFYLEGTNVVTFTVFWVFSALYLFVDLSGWPKWALQYKIQDGANQPVSLYQSYYCHQGSKLQTKESPIDATYIFVAKNSGLVTYIATMSHYLVLQSMLFINGL